MTIIFWTVYAGIGVVAAVVLLWTLILLVEIVLGLRMPKFVVPDATEADEVPPITVLIPAHNEAAGLDATLRALLLEFRPKDRVLVVADNCSDHTAVIAQRAGAETVSRNDPIRRGKGYALAYGLERLAKAPPEILVVLDADCRFEPGSLFKLTRECHREGRPCQSLICINPAEENGRVARLSQFAYFVINVLRPLGLRRSGLPCQLMGTGMAFPWCVIANMDMGTSHLSEDLMLGLRLAEAGHYPLFCPSAVVSTAAPDTRDAMQSQRSRWEQGRLKTLQSIPLWLVEAVRKGDLKLLGLTLDASVPPLSLLTLLATFSFIFGLIGILLGEPDWLVLFSILPIIMLTVAIGLAVNGPGQTAVGMRDFLTLPAYLLWKLPIYVKMLTEPDKNWQRAKRPGEN